MGLWIPLGMSGMMSMGLWVPCGGHLACEDGCVEIMHTMYVITYVCLYVFMIEILLLGYVINGSSGYNGRCD